MQTHLEHYCHSRFTQHYSLYVAYNIMSHIEYSIYMYLPALHVYIVLGSTAAYTGTYDVKKIQIYNKS